MPKKGLLLQAEVAPGSQRTFESRYLKATGQTVSPGSPEHYQNQPNKWGTELRIYFNDPGLATTLTALGKQVETGRNGYLSRQYAFRVNDNRLWWQLVEGGGLKLGLN